MTTEKFGKAQILNQEIHALKNLLDNKSTNLKKLVDTNTNSCSSESYAHFYNNEIPERIKGYETTALKSVIKKIQVELDKKTKEFERL